MKRIRIIMSLLMLTVVFLSAVPIQTNALRSDYVIYNNVRYPVVDLKLDGNIILEKSALLVDGVTMVPFRAICNAFDQENGSVTWYEKTSKAIYMSKYLKITAVKGRNYIEANGRCLYNTEEVKIINNTMYVPIRSVALAFGAKIEWDGQTRSANLVTSGKVILPGSSFYNQDDLYWLSRIINAESKYEPLLGKIAVANVVLNRVDSAYFPNNVYDVVFDSRYGMVQFHPAETPAIHETPIEEAVAAAKITLEGYRLSDEILYFCNVKLSTNTWIIDNCKFQMQIGNHSFYS